MVLETPPKALGTIDDMWFRWIIDIGVPGPDRGEGGKYLIVPPGYEGPLPEGGFFVARVADQPRALCSAASFLENNDPKPAVDDDQASSPRSTPTTPAASAPASPSCWTGKARLGRDPPAAGDRVPSRAAARRSTPFRRTTSASSRCSTSIVQQEPAATLDPELMGPIAAIGIVKGKPFAPDARMKKILTEAVAVGNATVAQPVHEPARSGLVLLPRLGVDQHAVRGRLRVRDADPDDHARGRQAVPADRLPARSTRATAFFYGSPASRPAMAMRLPGIGSQYLFGFTRRRQELLRRRARPTR